MRRRLSHGGVGMEKYVVPAKARTTNLHFSPEWGDILSAGKRREFGRQESAQLNTFVFSLCRLALTGNVIPSLQIESYRPDFYGRRMCPPSNRGANVRTR